MMDDRNNYDSTINKQITRILSMNREATRFFHKCLQTEDGTAGYKYLKERGLTDDTINKFCLGFAPASFNALTKHLMKKGYTRDELVSANLSRHSPKNPKYIYDNFRNRVIFPISDINGNIIAFGGRVMDDSNPKYLNTADTLAYKKSKGVFALNFAKKSGKDSLILCEGYMDVIAMHQAGFTNTVAGLGTALTSEQANLLSQYASEVLLCYDADETGQRATERALRIFKNTNAEIKTLQLSGGKDPDEIIKNCGVEKMKTLIKEAENKVEFILRHKRNKYNLATDDGKIQYIKEAIKIISGLSEIELEIYASRLADEFSVSKEVIIFEARNWVENHAAK